MRNGTASLKLFTSDSNDRSKGPRPMTDRSIEDINFSFERLDYPFFSPLELSRGESTVSLTLHPRIAAVVAHTVSEGGGMIEIFSKLLELTGNKDAQMIATEIRNFCDDKPPSHYNPTGFGY